MKLKIRKLRQECKLTQDQLALETGISQPTISCLENDAWNPSVETLRPIAAFFGLTIEQLYENDETGDESA